MCPLFFLQNENRFLALAAFYNPHECSVIFKKQNSSVQPVICGHTKFMIFELSTHLLMTNFLVKVQQRSLHGMIRSNFKRIFGPVRLSHGSNKSLLPGVTGGEALFTNNFESNIVFR